MSGSRNNKQPIKAQPFCGLRLFSERCARETAKLYYRLKVQKLLLFLCMIDVSAEQQREFYTPQVEIVKKIHQRLTENLQERATIAALAKEYLINPTTLKETFEGVYGQPIGAYMKTYRIRAAVTLPRQTRAPITEIAAQVGDVNQSKFAFRDVLKLSLSEYRRQNPAE